MLLVYFHYIYIFLNAIHKVYNPAYLSASKVGNNKSLAKASEKT